MQHVCPREDCRLAVALLGRDRDFVAGDVLTLLLKDGDHVHTRAAALADQEHLSRPRTRVAVGVVEDDLVAGAGSGGEPAAGPVVAGCGSLDGHSVDSLGNRGRRTMRRASIGPRPGRGTRRTTSALSTTRLGSAASSSWPISSAVNRRNGSGGPPSPSVAFRRSWPTTTIRPPNATAAAARG